MKFKPETPGTPGKETNTQKVYERLKAKGDVGADTNELIVYCNTTRPSNAIVELRKQGYNIITDMRTNENTHKTYGVYILVEDNERNVSNDR